MGTNTAARELLEDVLGNLLGEEAIVWVETTTDGKYAEKMHALCNKARESIATLTQQQGGEQEAGDGLPEFPEPHGYIDVQGLATEKNSTNFRMLLESHRNGKPRWSERLTLIYTADQMRAYATAALRTKQPEASEGGAVHIMRAAFVTADENYSGKRVAAVYADASMIGQRVHIIPAASIDNTSKQAAVEAVGYTAQHSIDLIARGGADGVTFGTYSERYERTVPLYIAPRHPADGAA